VSTSHGSADSEPNPQVPARAVSAPIVEFASRRVTWQAAAIATASVAAPLIIWWLVALIAQQVRHTAFPTPYDTYLRLDGLVRGKLMNDFPLHRHVADSLRRWGVGFGLAMVLGISSGLLLGWSRLLERLSMPTVTVLQLVPGLAWIPVAMLLLGVNESATIFMIAVTALAPIIINTTAGVKGVDEMFLRAGRMMGANDRTLFLRVLLPGSLPHLLSGLRVGFANGWRVLVAGEMIVGTGTGLGYSMIQARWNLDYAGAFVCIAIICAIGLIVERGILLPLERRTVSRWGLARST
jgi:ABC-type nitrate/sulfonate/bicarbonate transport system permease component